MKSLTRREILQGGSSLAATAMLHPVLGPREPTRNGVVSGTQSEAKESLNVEKAGEAMASSDEICFMDATVKVENLRTKKISWK
jgi:hypothetical protein